MTSGSLLGSFIEPEVSSRNTRLLRGFSACTSKPRMPICISFLPSFHGDGVMVTVGLKGCSRVSGRG